MRTNGNDKNLEAYKIFPYVAWAVIIGFVFLVYNIAVELQTVTNKLATKTQQLEYRLATPPMEIKDFEN